jgi:hypothetical protein
LGEEGNVRSRSFSGADFSAPVPRQQLVDALCRMIWQASEHVGEPSLWIDVVELGGGDQRVDDSRATAAFVRRGLIMPGVWRRKLRSRIPFIH